MVQIDPLFAYTISDDCKTIKRYCCILQQTLSIPLHIIIGKGDIVWDGRGRAVHDHGLDKICKGAGVLLIRKWIALLLMMTFFLFEAGCAEDADVYEDNTAADVFADTTMAADFHPDGIKDHSASAVVYCADNGEVLYGHHIHDRKAIASITKIMTAIIALEYAAANDKAVTVTSEMYAEGSSMYLKEGEIIRLSQLVRGMMAVSGNDAANAAAIAVAGSAEKFAGLMNEKAYQLGMKNTQFVTPSGLDSEGHYSTAYDMALLCAYAMENDTFADIVSQQTVSVEYISPEGKVQTFRNHNKLLSICEGCIGIKTGFTKKAGRTLTSCCERDGIRLVVVTLNDGDDWNDHCGLYDYCFSLVERRRLCDTSRTVTVPLVGGTNDSVELVPEKELDITIRKDEANQPQEVIEAPHFIYAPAVRGRIYGRIRYLMGEKEIASCRLVTGTQ